MTKSPIEQAREHLNDPLFRNHNWPKSKADLLLEKLIEYAESLEQENKRLTGLSQILCGQQGHEATAFEIRDGVKYCGICGGKTKCSKCNDTGKLHGCQKPTKNGLKYYSADCDCGKGNDGL